MYKRFLHITLCLPLLCAWVLPVNAQQKSECYTHKFRYGNDGWISMDLTQKKQESRSEARWQEHPADSALNGLVFSMEGAAAGDFLFIYKLFGGLQPSSVYKLTFLSSFTMQPESGSQGSVHLKAGANDLRPKAVLNRGNFSKNTGPRSGGNLYYTGSFNWQNPETHQRFYQHNYDNPVYCYTNRQGNLYVIMGLEKAENSGQVPDIYLNTLRINFEYAGEDTLERKRAFKVETTETEEKNIFTYEIHPLQEVIRYSIFTADGHLVMTEDDAACVPSCPNIIDASRLEPDQYWVEFVLLNEKRVVQPLIVK